MVDTVLIVAGLSSVLGLLVYVWYALALALLFPKLGEEGWKGWVPVLNEMVILERGGVPGWSVVFYFIPIVNLYGLYLKFTAMTVINKQLGYGAGLSVVGIFLPPVWATVLGFGSAERNEFDERVSGIMGESSGGGTDLVASGPLAAPSSVDAGGAPVSGVNPPVMP